MGRVIATAWGVRGDVMPYVAIGAELRKRGHEVQLLSNPAYEEAALEAGLSFVPVGTHEQYHALVGEHGLWDRRTYVRKGIEHFLPLVEAMYRVVLNACGGDRDRERDTVLLPSREGAWIVREKLDLPAVALRLSPSLLGSRLDPKHPSRPFPEWTNPIVRTRFGLRLLRKLKMGRAMLRGSPPVPRSVMAYLDEIRRVRRIAGLAEYPVSLDAVRPNLAICLWPSWFSPPLEDWPPDTKIAGFPFHPKPRSAKGAPMDSKSRPVVFIRGSAASRQTHFFVQAVECCQKLGSPGVLVTPHRDNVPFPLPRGVRHLSFTPLGELFARARAVVHHGGIGTMAYAFAAGIPQVVVPIVGDQYDLGYRMERLGAGSLLTKEPITAGRLARELSRLDASERVRSRCESLRERIDPDAGCSLAADWIEEVMESSHDRTALRGRRESTSGIGQRNASRDGTAAHR